MPTTDRLADTARWLCYAEEDLITAETLLKHPHLPPRQACWYAQQVTEQARAVWTSVSTALAEHGYSVEKDL